MKSLPTPSWGGWALCGLCLDLGAPWLEDDLFFILLLCWYISSLGMSGGMEEVVEGGGQAEGRGGGAQGGAENGYPGA